MSYDVGEQTKAAVIVRDDITDYEDDTGWGVEAWSTCDPAELGVDVASELGVQVWEDADGRPVSTTEVVSSQGPEHCDWQDITFLLLGYATDIDRKYDEFVSADPGVDLETAPDPSATLPGDAVDTGWQRDGRELWVAEDPRAAYLVSIDDPRDVQLWPAATEPIGCA